MYIRTKDGRILDFDKLNEVSKLSIDMSEEPIRESDTIEELCDRFVAKTCDITEYWVEKKLECAKMYCGVETIYGAIWTDKGLIYVAKMNDKGDLELI